MKECWDQQTLCHSQMGLEFDSPKKAQLKLGFGDENKIILQLEQKVVSAIGCFGAFWI
jgi:hypothetical protein